MTIAERPLQDYLDSCAYVDGWVVLYCLTYWAGQEPVYCLKVRSTAPHHQAKWVSGSLATCTVFDSYDEAVVAANRLAFIRDLPPEEKRIVKIKIKTTVELQEDRPVDVLDALAEV